MNHSSDNLLIGAISGNYTIKDIQTWVDTSEYGFSRTLIVFNAKDNTELIPYLESKNIKYILPTFDFWGNEKDFFEHHTGRMNLQNSFDLIHNMRFMYIHRYLTEEKYNKVLVTDVKDVKFNSDPFTMLPSDKLVATGEVIKYKDHDWNMQHLIYNLGIFGFDFKEYEVLNVGVFGGSAELVKNISRDIFLLSAGKPKVADQTSFNYLARTLYKDKFIFTSINDLVAVHCHVIKEGHVKFNLDRLKMYPIVHQYDRL